MRFALFYHSLVSDWNHGNAHFLRGVVRELKRLGHAVRVYEPEDGWSRINLVSEHGQEAIDDFHRAYPGLTSTLYAPAGLDLDATLDGVDAVLVHEWTDTGLVRRLSQHHIRRGGYRLLFHDTHHRAVTDPEALAAYDLSGFDGVLAFGGALRDLYLAQGWAARAWAWHEAADAEVFRPLNGVSPQGDLVWIGNWGDDERTAELQEFLLGPVHALRLRAQAYGVRYPEKARQALARAGLRYGGWLPNYRVPAAFAAHRVTVHIPRRPYVAALPGIPTIRPFEALACGIPLVCSPWEDCEELFRPGRDYLVAKRGKEMQECLQAVLSDDGLASRLSRNGRETILARHTCAHRVGELLEILRSMG